MFELEGREEKLISTALPKVFASVCVCLCSACEKGRQRKRMRDKINSWTNHFVFLTDKHNPCVHQSVCLFKYSHFKVKPFGKLMVELRLTALFTTAIPSENKRDNK